MTRERAAEMLAEHSGRRFTAPLREAVTGATYDERLTVDPAVDDAYRAARSARFEFGESG